MKIDRYTKYKVQLHIDKILSLYSNIRVQETSLPIAVGWRHPNDPESVLVCCPFCGGCLHRHGRPAAGGSPLRRADCGGGSYLIVALPHVIPEFVLVAAELRRREGSREAREDRAGREWRDMLAEMKGSCLKSRENRGCQSTSRFSGSQDFQPTDRLALELEPLIAARARENMSAGGGSGVSGRQISDNPIDTKRELATLAGVSHDTIAKVKTIEQKAAPGRDRG